MSPGNAQVRVRSLSVLLAEDSMFHQKHAVRLLKTQGHRVTVARNGREVLEAIENRRFDVILMDIEMPEMDGLTATRLIRSSEDELLGRTPIVAVTSNDNREECLEAGMDAYLRKPLQTAALERTLQRILGRSAA